jgi:hypothetical protein
MEKGGYAFPRLGGLGRTLRGIKLYVGATGDTGFYQQRSD